MGATCKTCTGVIEPAMKGLNRNTNTAHNGESDRLISEQEEGIICMVKNTDPNTLYVEGLDSTFFQDLARFIRSLPPKSKQHIWNHAMKIRTSEGKKIITDKTMNKNQINKLLCDNMIVYVKV